MTAPTGNAATIVAFLKAQGFSNAGIAAVLGNFQVESGFNPGASNAGEGAIGIAQWEDGRRTALDAYAKAHGGSEGDLNTQLGYMMQELAGRPNVLQAMKTATDPGAAAAIWDAQFEGSAGTTRDQRVSNAQSIFKSNLIPGTPAATGSTSTAPTATGAGTPGTASPHATAADYTSALGTLSGLFTAIPELKTLLANAVKKGETSSQFITDFQGSDFYKTHGTAARTAIALKYSDPTTYNQNQAQKVTSLMQYAQQAGVHLTKTQANNLAYASIMHGWDTATEQQNVGALWRGDNASQAVTGQAATTQQTLQATAASYGIPIGHNALAAWTQKVMAGTDTTDSFKQSMMQQAKSLYPSLSAQIDAGTTVATAADPYIQTKANLLEVDPSTITLNDPTIKKALQGTTTTASNGTSSTSSVPLWQFEQQVKADPRWGYTQNAHQAISSTLLTLGKDWGFAAA